MERVSALQIADEEMKIAQQMAREWVERETDANEVHKVLRFLVSDQSGPLFFTFLDTLQRNGNVVVRSRQTLAHHAAIRQVCQRHLRPYQDQAARMQQILGWAIRLIPFYRLEPHLPKPATARPATTAGSVPSASGATRPTPVKSQQPTPQRLAELRPGQELTGRVVKVASIGAFVDIGVGRDGLVHVSKLRAGFVHKAEDVVQVGGSVTVWVEQVDQEQSRISLTMIDPQGDTAADEIAEQEPTVDAPPPKPRTPRPAAIQVGNSAEAQPGVWVLGKVTKIETNRILVDIGLDKPASLAFAQLAGQPTDPDVVAERLPAGTPIEARILRTNPKGQVQLTLKV